MLLKCNFGPESETTYAESVGLSKLILHKIPFLFRSLFATIVVLGTDSLRSYQLFPLWSKYKCLKPKLSSVSFTSSTRLPPVAEGWQH